MVVRRPSRDITLRHLQARKPRIVSARCIHDAGCWWDSSAVSTWCKCCSRKLWDRGRRLGCRVQLDLETLGWRRKRHVGIKRIGYSLCHLINSNPSIKPLLRDAVIHKRISLYNMGTSYFILSVAQLLTSVLESLAARTTPPDTSLRPQSVPCP